MPLETSARSPSDVTDTDNTDYKHVSNFDPPSGRISSRSYSRQYEYFNPSQSVPSAVYSLLDSVDSESIAEECEIGRHSSERDFENHVKIAIREGLDPSSSLAELAETTDTADDLKYMAASTFSRYTNDRDYGTVVRLLFELLHTRRLYHQRSVLRKQLEWLSRGVIATDATNLTLTRSVTVNEDASTDDDPAQIDPSDGGLTLHMAARVNVEQIHPVCVGVSRGQSHESPQ